MTTSNSAHDDGAPSRRLWSAVVATTSAARQSGALLTTATTEFLVPVDGLQFLVRLVAGLAHKPRTNTPRPATGNPFLPYDRELYVADVGPNHVCLLNKFNVVEHHALLVTREFEDQDTLLTLADFEAWCACLADYPSLGFYNGGRTAGASQPHKHMQLVPLPLSPTHPAATLVDFYREQVRGDEQPRQLTQLPIRHRVAAVAASRWPSQPAAARHLWNVYGQMLCELGLCPSWPSPLPSCEPYNLLLTREWLLLVPRRQECFESLSLNALAFGGALLARTEEELRLIRAAGPWALWRAVGYPA